MKIFTLLFLLLFSILGNSQEIGSAKNGMHSIKLIHENENFHMIYTDVNSSNKLLAENSFQFNVKESIFEILMGGFDNSNSRQIILKVPNETIIKLNYQYTNGEKLVSIKQYNLNTHSSGSSALFKKKEIISLFGIVQ